MRKIILNTARLVNSGARREAGAEITVGDKGDQIRPDVAKGLVARGLAAEIAKPSPKAEAAGE